MKTEQPSLLPDEQLLGQYRLVPLADLPANDAIAMQGPEPSAELVENVRKRGILQPIWITGEGSLKIVAGRRRLKAARKAGLTEIPALWFEGLTFTSLQVLAISENTLRHNNALSDLNAIDRLVHQGASEAQIVEATGLPLVTLRKRMKLLNLTPVLRTRLEQGMMEVSTAETIATLPKEKQIALSLQKEGKITAKDVADLKRVAATQVVASLDSAMFSTPALSGRTVEQSAEQVVQILTQLQEADKQVALQIVMDTLGMEVTHV